MDDILLLDGITTGNRLKLTRIAKGLRQVDVASNARVSVRDVCNAEKDRHISRSQLLRIYAVLEIEMLDGEWPIKPRRPNIPEDGD